MAVWLTGPRRHWVVFGSFTPRLYSGTLISLLFGLNEILLNLTLGSRYHFHPESSLLLMIVCCTWRPWRYSSIIPETLVPSAFSIPYYRYIHMDNNIHLLFIQLLWVSLVITRYIELLSGFLRIPCTTTLQFLAAWIPLRIITRACRVSAHPQMIRVFHKVFEIPFDLPKILRSLFALEILAYLHYGCFPYVWQYSLVSLGTIVLILLIQPECECT